MEQYNNIQQLMKKEDEQKDRKPVYPPTVIQAVFDGKTGASLEAILAQFNSIYVQYQGTSKDTRLIIPMEMRRAGLTITYMDMESNTITERANSAVQKDNDYWGLDVNWSRVDELSLSGDISVSAKGTWIINGNDTGIKALGPKGDAGLTPWLKTIDNKLHFSYDNVTWEPCSENIAAWFRWSGNKIQISRDNKTWTDLSSKFADNVHIKGYVANYASLPSGAVQGEIYGVGPTYAAEDTAHTNPIYRYYVRNANTWVDNGAFTSLSAGVVQETGDSETEVMSQKAVSTKLSELGSEVGNFYLVGNNKDVSIFNYKNTIGGNVYRVYLDNTSYDVSGVPEGFIKLNIGYIVNGEAVYSYQYSTHTDLRKYYDVEIPKDSVSAEMIISIRATKGVKVWFRIEDITECVNLSSEISSIDEVSNESASFLQGKSHAIHGAIEQDSGVVISNNIRAITLPIRHKMSDIGKEVRVKCSLPESIVFNGISYAYLGDTPVKRITVAYENEYLSYMTDSSFDNIRTTFKRLDEGVITERELRDIVVLSEGLEDNMPYINEASSIAMSLVKREEVAVTWEVGGITAAGNNAESEGLLRTSMLQVDRKLIISVPSQIQNHCFYVLYKNDKPIDTRVSEAPLTIDKNTFPYDYDSVRPILIYDKEVYSIDEILGIAKSIKVETEYIGTERNESLKYKGLLMCSIGDSITYGHTPTGTPNAGAQLDSYAKLAAFKMGMKFLNYGISGNQMAGTASDNPMCIRYSLMDDNADVITLMGGTNDIRNGVQLGTMSDRSTTTYYGALHTIMSGLYRKYIINNNKKTKIVVITPPKLIGTPSVTAFGEGTIRANQEEWVNAMIEVAKYYSMPVLDFFHSGLIATQLAGDYYKNLKDYYGYEGYFNPLMPDGIHPTQEGHEIISDLLVGFLNGLC